MVRLYTLDAVVSNVTNTTFKHQFSLVDGPFGLRELESTTSFPARNGLSRTISIQTSDIAIFTLVTILATFAIDRHFFKSRYLIHVGGLGKKKHESDVLNEKASLHEKEALNVEAGETTSESPSEPKSDTGALTTWRKWTIRAMFIIATCLFLTIGYSEMKKVEAANAKQEAKRSTTDTDTPTEEKDDTPRAPFRWRRLVDSLSTYLFIPISILALLGFQTLFWPFYLTYFILSEILISGDLYKKDPSSAPDGWKWILLKLLLFFTIWTIAGATLMHKPTRYQIKIWAAFKWTHAVSWWLFWGILELKVWGGLLAKGLSLSIRCLPEQSFVFVMRPFLFAYLCSGMVCNCVSAFRVFKYVREHDPASPDFFKR